MCRAVDQFNNKAIDVVASGCAGDIFDKRLIISSMPDHSRALFDVAGPGHADDIAVLRSTPDPNLSSRRIACRLINKIRWQLRSTCSR
uniref:Uncharacterized protein n=1 Tax=Ditylenchus dipsaci TaxID=166011 RepID=A0A915DYC7_9BILA